MTISIQPFLGQEEEVKRARLARDPNTKFRLQLKMKPNIWLGDLKPKIVDLHSSCQNGDYAHGWGTHATLDALEQYTGQEIESVHIRIL